MKIKQKIEDLSEKNEKKLAKLPTLQDLSEQGERLLEVMPNLSGGTKQAEGYQFNPKISPHENVEQFFFDARSLLAERTYREEIKHELQALLNTFLTENGANISETDLPPLRFKPKQTPSKIYREFLSNDGAHFWCGKGSKDNDKLTLQVASKQDTFLHVRNVAGSHVIIPFEGAPPSHETLEDAAQIAIHYSKARFEKRPQVTVALVRDISKRSGDPAGRVMVKNAREESFYRDPQRLARLLIGMK